MVASDPQRPAAVTSRSRRSAAAPGAGLTRSVDADPVKVAARGVEQARAQGRDVVIVDTAGRLHVDQELMDQLVKIKEAVKPHNVLLVARRDDGPGRRLGRRAVPGAVGFTGVVLTKIDGDARGGAALSVRAVTGKPIKFVSVGEKPDQLEPFHPDRIASRILGMGDVMSLIEKAQEQISEDDAKEMEASSARPSSTLDDFLDQLQQVRKMGRRSSPRHDPRHAPRREAAART